MLLSLAASLLLAIPNSHLPSTSQDSASLAAITAELRALYRDLDDANATALVTHFYPAKVTARFAVPDTDPNWIALVPPPIIAEAHADAFGHCAPSAAIALVGSWARVQARRCGGEVDELWFYSMSGRWKVIHLIFGTLVERASLHGTSSR